jgi:hypothetical protein
VHYDSVSDRVVVILFAQGNRQGVFVWNPETGAWADESLPLPEKLKASRGCGHGFYSAEANAHFFYTAGDSDDRGTMWVYRHKKADGPRP